MYATSYSKVVIISFLPLGQLRVTPRLALILPSVSFILKKPLSMDMSKQSITRLGPDASKLLSGKATFYPAPALQFDIFSTITHICTPYLNAGRDAVNPDGLNENFTLKEMFHAFLRVHVYSVFQSEDRESITSFERLVDKPSGSVPTTRITRRQDREAW
ncbi:hypothetical protein GcC1_095025 [Golovinomyces cichoracearum]|uniref:Uncharacterized protein n=1 Tax=Golovinomyces cichoracearum TaxID=62708 RepID=A0A420IC46_9PEZI|nr:hypothetical protein GcC1_095025 [Golovinomyces cichoracearum]